ncbi:MAG: ATPase [Oscillospiraceae bacterium]|nr:ATPase [Oscillospiraceae bacterium]
MNIEEILAMMDEILDRAVAVPFSGRKSLIDVEAMNNLIHDIRMNLPREIDQARGVVNERKQLISDASREADRIIKRAEERANQMVAAQEVVRMAQMRAEELMINAQQRSKELHHTSRDHVDEMLEKTETLYLKNLEEIRKSRMAIKNVGNKNTGR